MGWENNNKSLKLREFFASIVVLLFCLLLSCMNKRFLVHFDPFCLVDTDYLTTFAFYLITIVYCIITFNALLPAVQDPAFSDLQIFE